MEGSRAVWAGLASLALIFAVAGVLFSPSSPPAPSSPPSRGDSGAGSGGGWGGQAPGASGEDGGPALRVLLPDGQVKTMALEDYVQGVVAAEMPAAFAPAALEAQAVCARTYALARLGRGVHAPQADVCTQSACCQGCALEPPAEWGEKEALYTAKLRAAVSATAGQVLRQNGALIDAVFHASSAGCTAPAQAVWGGSVPYLVSVSTPETAQSVPDLLEERVFTPQELEQLLGSREIGQSVLAEWGGVETLEVGGKVLSGQEVRQRLGLRSARFTVARRGEDVVFTTTGYGHGVGMSQQGANLMALDGASCQEILAHYYPGTALEAYE